MGNYCAGTSTSCATWLTNAGYALETCGSGYFCENKGTVFDQNCVGDTWQCTANPTAFPTLLPTLSPTKSPTPAEWMDVVITSFKMDELGKGEPVNVYHEGATFYSHSTVLTPENIEYSDVSGYRATIDGSMNRITDITLDLASRATEDYLYSLQIYQDGALRLEMYDVVHKRDSLENCFYCLDSKYKGTTDITGNLKTIPVCTPPPPGETIGYCTDVEKCEYISPTTLNVIMLTDAELSNTHNASCMDSLADTPSKVRFRVDESNIDYKYAPVLTSTPALKLDITQVAHHSEQPKFGNIRAYDVKGNMLANNMAINNVYEYNSQSDSTQSDFCLDEGYEVGSGCIMNGISSDCCHMKVEESVWEKYEDQRCEGTTLSSSSELNVESCKGRCIKNNECVAIMTHSWQTGIGCILMSDYKGTTKGTIPFATWNDCYEPSVIHQAQDKIVFKREFRSKSVWSYEHECEGLYTFDANQGPNGACSDGTEWFESVYSRDFSAGKIGLTLPTGTAYVKIPMDPNHIRYQVFEEGVEISDGFMEGHGIVIIDSREGNDLGNLNVTLFDIFKSICGDGASDIQNTYTAQALSDAAGFNITSLCAEGVIAFDNRRFGKFNIIASTITTVLIDTFDQYSFSSDVSDILKLEHNGTTYDGLYKLTEMYNAIGRPVNCYTGKEFEQIAKEMYDSLYHDIPVSCVVGSKYTFNGVEYFGGKQGAPCVANHQCATGLYCVKWECVDKVESSMCEDSFKSLLQPDYHVLRPAMSELTKCAEKEVYEDETIWDYSETNGNYFVTPRWRKTTCTWSESDINISPDFMKKRGNMQECGQHGSSEIYDMGISFTEGFTGFDTCPSSEMDDLWNNYRGKSLRLIPHDIPDTMKITTKDITGRQSNYPTIPNAFAFDNVEYLEGIIDYNDVLCQQGFTGFDTPFVDFKTYESECNSYSDCQWHKTLKKCLSSSEYVQKQMCSMITDEDQCKMIGFCKYDWGTCMSTSEEIGKEKTDCAWSDCTSSPSCPGLSGDHVTNGHDWCRGGLFSICDDKPVCAALWHDRYRCCKITVTDTGEQKELNFNTLCSNQRTLSSCHAFDCEWDVITQTCVSDTSQLLQDGANHVRLVNKRHDPSSCSHTLRYDDNGDFIEFCIATDFDTETCEMYGFRWNDNVDECQLQDITHSVAMAHEIGAPFIDSSSVFGYPQGCYNLGEQYPSKDVVRLEGSTITAHYTHCDLPPTYPLKCDIALQACENYHSQPCYVQKANNDVRYVISTDVEKHMKVDVAACSSYASSDTCVGVQFCDWVPLVQECVFIGSNNTDPTFWLIESYQRLYLQALRMSDGDFVTENEFTEDVDYVFSLNFLGKPCQHDLYDDCVSSDVCMWDYSNHTCVPHKCQLLSNLYTLGTANKYTTHNGMGYDHELPILAESCKRISGCEMNTESFTCEYASSESNSDIVAAEDMYYCSQMSDLNDGMCNYYHPERSHVCMNVGGDCVARYMYKGWYDKNRTLDLVGDFGTTINYYDFVKHNLNESEVSKYTLYENRQCAEASFSAAWAVQPTSPNYRTWCSGFDIAANGNCRHMSASAVSECEKECLTSSDCRGFNVIRSNNGCWFKSNEITGSTTVDTDKDCYVRTSYIPVTQFLTSIELRELGYELEQYVLADVNTTDVWGTQGTQEVKLYDLDDLALTGVGLSFTEFKYQNLIHDILHHARRLVHKELMRRENGFVAENVAYKFWENTHVSRVFYPIATHDYLALAMDTLYNISQSTAFFDKLNEPMLEPDTSVSSDEQYLQKFIIQLLFDRTSDEYTDILNTYDNMYGFKGDSIKANALKSDVETRFEAATPTIGDQNQLSFDIFGDLMTDYVIDLSVDSTIGFAMGKLNIPSNYQERLMFVKKLASEWPERPIELLDVSLNLLVDEAITRNINRVFGESGLREQISTRLSKLRQPGATRLFRQNAQRSLTRGKINPRSIQTVGRSLQGRLARGVTNIRNVRAIKHVLTAATALERVPTQVNNFVQLVQEMYKGFRGNAVSKLADLKTKMLRSKSYKLVQVMKTKIVKAATKIAQTALVKAGVAALTKLAALLAGPVGLVLLLLDVAVEGIKAAFQVQDTYDNAVTQPIGCRYLHTSKYASNPTDLWTKLRIGFGQETDLLTSEKQCSERATYAFHDASGDMGYIDGRYNVPTCSSSPEHSNLDNYFSDTLNKNCVNDSECPSVSKCVIGKCVYDTGYLGNKYCVSKPSSTYKYVGSGFVASTSVANGLGTYVQGYWSDLVSEGKTVLDTCGTQYAEVATDGLGTTAVPYATCFDVCNEWAPNNKVQYHTFVKKMETPVTRNQCTSTIDCTSPSICVKGGYCAPVSCSTNDDCAGPYHTGSSTCVASYCT